MADKNTRKLAPKVIQADIKALDALESFPDYDPSNKDYSIVNAQAIRTKTTNDEKQETQDEARYKASRDKATMTQWERHDFVRGAIRQVAAQYGENSDELQAMGIKKKNEYKKPQKKTPVL